MLASRRRFSRPGALSAFLGVLGLFAALQTNLRPVSAQVNIAFVQVNSATPQSPSVTVSVPYVSAQTTGNLNVVVVGWNDATATVQSVGDSQGNTYQRAIGPTVRAGSATQSIYYAANIAAAPANVNTVTVTFSPAAAFADVRIAEYSGIATVNPVDVAVGAQGSSNSASSGAVTTTNANDLLIAADTVATHSPNAGTDFTARIVTKPDGDILEDRIITATGSYSGTASVAPSGWWIMQMVAFRAATPVPDTQPPTAPGTPVPTVVSGNQINLTWPAATDNVGVTGYLVERCNGAGCSTFAQVGTPATASFNDSGLTPSTSYSYRIRATDAANNLSAYSATATATTQAPDTQAPTAPGTPVLTVVSSGQINLTWPAATDNVAVTGYFVERCAGAGCSTFAQVGTPTAPSFNDTGVSPSITYSYRVRATDAANNLGPYSATASATTPAAASIAFVQFASAVPQSSPTSVPVTYAQAQSAGNLNVVVVGWNNSGGQTVTVTDSKGNTYVPAVGPTVFGGFATQSIYYAANIAAAAAGTNTVTVTFSAAAPFPDIRLAEYRGIATSNPVDGAVAAQGSSTTSSSGALVTTNGNDLLVAANLVQTSTTAAGAGFTSRGITVPDGDILEDQIVTTTGSYTATALIPSGGSWIMQLVAFKAAGSIVDTQPPTAPLNLVATPISQGQINLGWTAATDNVGVTGYRIERCQGSGCTTFVEIAAPIGTGTTFSDSTGLAASTSYSYRVRATDAASNLGPYSNIVSATTQAPPDTQPPTAPGTPVLSVISSTQINLTWSAATDNVGVTGYFVERCTGAGCSTFAQVASPATTSFNDTGLAPSTSYTYRVRAKDAANNLGAYSATATAGTQAGPDTQPPTAPGTPVLTVVSSTQINLAWSAATDNVGVTGYFVERCNGAGCTTFAQVASPATTSFNDTALTPSTSYSYRIRATDAANNLSPYSGTATAITQAGPDIQPPTAPGTPVLTVVSSTQINLSWSAATDNVGVTGYLVEHCNGAGCSTFAQVGTSTTASFNDTGLTPSTSYSYRVRATDAASNLGPYSATATATTQTPDTQAPTAPGTPVLTVVSSGQINLTWPAATDNVAVTGYFVERCAGAGCSTFAQVGTPTAPSFNDTGVSPSITYSYRVRATDAANNLGPYSATASATTPAAASIAFVQFASAVPQSSPTSVPVTYAQAQSAGNLNVVVVGWNNSGGQTVTVTDSKGNTYVPAVGPTVFGGFATQSIYYAANIAAAAAGTNTVTVTFSAAAPFPDIRLAEYRGIATSNPVDGAVAAQGSSTTSSSGALVTTNGNDLLVAANLVQTSTTAAGAGFTSRGITVPDGDILEDQIVTTTGSYTATALIPSGGSWIMQLVAFKAAGSIVDTQPPTAPLNLVATPISQGQINLGWTAATDNVGVTGYRIERCQGSGCTTFVEIAAPIGTGTTFSDSTGLAASTSYSYRVRATDAASNLGPYSNVVSATTLAPDTTPPSSPGTLTATAVSGTEIDISWGPATDNVGIAGYRVDRCQGVGCTNFSKFGTLVTTTSVADTTLNPNTSYSYLVAAQDLAGNLGPYTNVATATTLANNPSLVAAYAFGEGSGTTVGDLSGHGNTGTISNATWTTAGKFGNALTFNGTNALVTITDSTSLHLTTAMTLEAWVNPTAVSAAWRDVIYKGNDNYYLAGTTTNTGFPAGAGTIGGNNVQAYGTATLPLNTWSHLAATYDGSTVRLYLNGTQVGSLPQTGTISISAVPLTIGGDTIYGQYFQGKIDEVRVYSTALTPAQIQTDMNAPLSGSFPQVSLNPASVNFGTQNNGTTSAPVPVTVTNAGNVALTIGSVTITGPQAGDFAQTNTCGSPVAPATSCTINVTFTPTTGGARSATLTMSDNAPGSPHTVPLSGTGAGLSISPRTVVVVAGRPSQFTTTGGTGTVTWSVDNIAGGSTAVGTITTGGLYTAPGTVGTHTVTASASGQFSNATVYVSNNPGMFTHHNDKARTGQNQNEIVLTTANVNASAFGKLATFSTDGISHASPLYVANVNIPSIGLRNVVYVATEHDSVYAFDADAPGGNPLWKVSFINPGAGITTVPNGDTGECCDITPEIGITGTPVIDPATSTLYVVAKTKEGNNTYVNRLHALDITTGAEKFGGPVVIQASVPGTGNGSAGGTLPFDQLRENQRTAMVLHNGVVYFGFGSHGDNQPYHGWLLGYNATTLQRVFVYNSTPNGEGGGIWLSGGAPVIDGNNNFFFATGDGSFDANSNGVDFGDSFLRLSVSGATGTVLDYFTPHNEGTLDSNNLDLDAGGLILLPDQSGTHPHLLVSAGKDGSIFLVDRDNMTHFHAADQNPQTLVNIFPFGTPLPGNYSSPVYFNGAVYFGPVADVLQMFKLNNGLLTTAPTSTSPEAYSYPGGALAISANGNLNGILWAVQKNGTTAGALHAYDASNLSFELYNSDQAGTRDTLDVAAKFAIPLVVNGKVFVASNSKLTVYGLLP
jgi:phosphodiesterase/alkaline phosphatase D-like protein